MGISWQARGDRGISTLQKIITTAVAATVGAGVLVAAPAWGDTIVCRIGGLIVGTAAACPGGEFVGGGPAGPPLTATPQNPPAPSGSPIPRRTLLDGELADDDGLLIGGGYTATVDPSVPATANVTYATPYGPITLPYQDFAVSCYGTGFDTCVGWIPWYAEEYGRRLDTAMPSLATCAPHPADAARPVEFELVADPTSHWADVLVRTGTGVTSLAGVGELDDDPGRYAAAAYAVRQFLLQLSMRPAPANATQAAQLRLTLDAIGRFVPRLESASESVAGLDCAAYADAVTALGTSTAGDPIGAVEVCTDSVADPFAAQCSGYDTETALYVPESESLDPRIPVSWEPGVEAITSTTLIPNPSGGAGRLTSTDEAGRWCESRWQECLDRVALAADELKVMMDSTFGAAAAQECSADRLRRLLVSAEGIEAMRFHAGRVPVNLMITLGTAGVIHLAGGSYVFALIGGAAGTLALTYMSTLDLLRELASVKAAGAKAVQLAMHFSLLRKLVALVFAMRAQIQALATQAGAAWSYCMQNDARITELERRLRYLEERHAGAV